MNRNLLYSIKGMFVAAAALVGVAACTDDDHFDVQVSGSAAESVWDNMRNAGQLNDFLSVLERTTVMRSENDQAATITYADLLKQPQYFTIWAPEDGTYDVSRYKALLDSADKAKQAGNMVAFRDFNNTVETQFVRNHISRSSFANATAPLRVQLMNNKRVVYDPAGQTFNEVALDNTFGFRSANNGMLYKLTGISPFAYNILEYLEENPDWAAVNEFVHCDDTLYFNAGGSVEGALVDGEMVYVDSAFVTISPNARYLGNASAEDSTYVAVIPNNEAWEAAVEKLKPYFNYGTTYYYNLVQTEDGIGRFNTSINYGEEMTMDGEMTQTDSLREYGTRMALLSSMVFSATNFPGVDVTDGDQVVNYARTADSLISTRDICIYNQTPGQVNAFFGTGEPVKASNGYIYTVDDFKLDPVSAIQDLYPVDFDVEDGANDIGSSNVASRIVVTLDTVTRNPDVKGTVHEESYVRYERASTSRMTIDFSLPNVLSAKYDIYAVMLPSEINRNYITSDSVREVCTFNADLYSDYGTENPAPSDRLASVTDLEVSQDSVSHILLFEDFKFDKSYFNLTINTFPRLRLTLPAGSAANALNIDRIYLVPKGNDVEGEVDEIPVNL